MAIKSPINLGELLRGLGVSANRVVLDPPPGMATIRDLIQFNDTKRNEKLYELVDGTLVDVLPGFKLPVASLFTNLEDS
jgi:hypothetical protein